MRAIKRHIRGNRNREGRRGLYGAVTRIYDTLSEIDRSQIRRYHMAWTKPILTEIACGMEINMYAPAEDEPVLF